MSIRTLCRLEGKRQSKIDAVSKAKFVNIHIYTMFDVSDADKINYYVRGNKFGWVCGSNNGWNIYGVCDVKLVEDETLTPIWQSYGDKQWMKIEDDKVVKVQNSLMLDKKACYFLLLKRHIPF